MSKIKESGIIFILVVIVFIYLTNINYGLKTNYDETNYNNDNGNQNMQGYLLLYQGRLTSEGMGSYFQHIKSSIILSLYNNYELIIDRHKKSGHKYNIAEMLDINNKNNLTSKYIINHKFTNKEMNTMCNYMNGKINESSYLNRFKFTQNTVMYNLTNLETEQSYNDCIQPWISKIFNNVFKKNGYIDTINNNKTNIGIHLRFGDLSTTDLDNLNNRSIPISIVNNVINKMKKEEYNFYVFMQKAPLDLANKLNFNYTLVDNSNDLLDLFLYSKMDCYFQGISSWSVLGSMIYTGKEIVTNNKNHPKYIYKFNQIHKIYDESDITEQTNFCKSKSITDKF